MEPQLWVISNINCVVKKTMQQSFCAGKWKHSLKSQVQTTPNSPMAGQERQAPLP